MGLISSRDFVDLLHVKPYPGDILTTNCKLHVTTYAFVFWLRSGNPKVNACSKFCSLIMVSCTLLYVWSY